VNGSWFEAMAADATNRTELYRHLGFAELRLVVEQTDGDDVSRYGLVLDGYDVEYAGDVDDLDAFGTDAVITGARETWDEMFANIIANGGADGMHTLNAMSIAEAPLRVYSPNPVGRDKFFRFAETLQTLFDSMATAPVTA
jgi:hypothetical protein